MTKNTDNAGSDKRKSLKTALRKRKISQHEVNDHGKLVEVVREINVYE